MTATLTTWARLDWFGNSFEYITHTGGVGRQNEIFNSVQKKKKIFNSVLKTCEIDYFAEWFGIYIIVKMFLELFIK